MMSEGCSVRGLLLVTITKSDCGYQTGDAGLAGDQSGSKVMMGALCFRYPPKGGLR